MSFLDTVRNVFWRGPKAEARSMTVESVFGAFAPAMLAPQGMGVAAGLDVNGTTAMTVSAVWNAVNQIAGSGVASIPLKVFREIDGGREEAKDHYLYRLIHDAPNPYSTRFVFLETLLHHVLLWGNGYAEIEWDGAGRPVGLWPLNPQNMAIIVRNGIPEYRYNGKIVNPVDLVHVPGLGFDGVKGYSVLTMARQSLSLSMATERFGAAFFGNGAWPGLVATYPGALTDNARRNLRDSLNQQHKGADRAHSTLILEEGAKVEKVGIPPEDAQFLQTRSFSVIEVARWFNIPPHKLKDLARATWSNAEQMNQEFVTDCLRPWYVRIEQELNRKLVSDSQKGSINIEFVAEGLLRGDIKTRYDSYALGRQWGFLTVNEIRGFENLNKIPGKIGDQLLSPANMTPSEKLGEVPPLPTPPAAPPSGDAPSAEPAVRASIRALVIDAAARMIRKEANEARRASKSPEKLQAWAERFYGDHASQMAEAIAPAVRALCAVNGASSPDLRAMFGDMAKAHAEQILSLPASSALEAQVERLVSGWEVHVPSEIADVVPRGADRGSNSAANINLTVNVPPGATTVENRFTAPAQTPPVVNVAAPTVNVSAPNVEIRNQAPDVQQVRIVGAVESVVSSMPESPDTITTVQTRDPEGRPIKVLHQKARG